jgi:MoaA/NifB/PqqE/SkfB family radical SAM enzyme
MAKIKYAQVNERGEITLPPDLARELGLSPGDELRVESNGDGLHFHPSITTLRKVYVEATNKCNLTCSTCVRNIWDTQFGNMSAETFDRILSGMQNLSHKPEIFFGGYGEPLSHPQILEFIAKAKGLGHRVSLITNGILLTEQVSRKLIDLKLDMLWVSLDGASPESYVDVRLGDSLPLILENLKRLQQQKYYRYGASNWAGNPKLGIAFVAMKRNIHEMNEVIRLGSRLGAVEFSISNVLAYNAELLEENLYMRAMSVVVGQEIRPLVHLPLMNIQPHTKSTLLDVLNETNRLDFSGALLNQNIDQCLFIERGSVAVRWDGKVSPCLPLLYTHKHYLDERERTSHEYFAGDLNQQDLMQIWNEKNYVELRKRLQDFDFSPCAFCNSCEMASENVEDCFGNIQPTCGGCLWARGLIRCP